MTETHTGSRYLLQPIALDKPAVWLGNPKHIVWTNKKTKPKKKYSTNHISVTGIQWRWTEAQL